MTLSFPELAAVDTVGRARAYGSLRSAGMTDAGARVIVGYEPAAAGDVVTEPAA